MIDESHKGIPPEELDQQHPYAWFFRRVRDLHDVWHVLTGYGRDALGEMCLVTFSFQETHGLGWALIAGGLVLWALDRFVAAGAGSGDGAGHPGGAAPRKARGLAARRRL